MLLKGLLGRSMGTTANTGHFPYSPKWNHLGSIQMHSLKRHRISHYFPLQVSIESLIGGDTSWKYMLKFSRRFQLNWARLLFSTFRLNHSKFSFSQQRYGKLSAFFCAQLSRYSHNLNDSRSLSGSVNHSMPPCLPLFQLYLRGRLLETHFFHLAQDPKSARSHFNIIWDGTLK